MTVTVAPAAADGDAPDPVRRGGRWRAVGLVAALAAAGALIALPSTRPVRPAAAETLTLARVWPDAKPAEIPGALSDGPAYAPLFMLDAGASVGTAPSPDGSQLRLVLRGADGRLRELRRLPIAASPQYVGFVVTGDDLAWAELVSDGAGLGHTEIWAGNIRTAVPPRRLTADTGDVAFFNSQYDMVANDGRVYWLAVPPAATQGATELRSVALAGGDVTTRTEPGQWALSAWPWLVSAGSGQTGPVQLRDLVADKLIKVNAAPTELVTCSATWCRVLILAGDGPSRLDLMRPDGSDRRQVAGGTATASVMDVALLDRFEVLSLADAQTAVSTKQQLALYDIGRKRTVVVAEGVGSVLTRAGVLWWSTGDNETMTWHALDLRALD
ncbi:hypothetical protein [Micromonospora sp. NPDC049679]|uniref:hypothetical protein n=1 Tax=Micromonospora sp. NPDC049679 TaxID=3155920 RepID=UPI0033C0A717